MVEDCTYRNVILEICTLLRLTSCGRTSTQNSNKLKGGLMAPGSLLEGCFVRTLLLYARVGRSLETEFEILN